MNRRTELFGYLRVEAFDISEILQGYVRHFLQRAEALGYQQMSDDVVDIVDMFEDTTEPAGQTTAGAAPEPPRYRLI